jgi:hypothetical protein
MLIELEIAHGKTADLGVPSWKNGIDAMAEASRLVNASLLDPDKAHEYRFIDRVELKLTDDPKSRGGARIRLLVVGARQLTDDEDVACRLKGTSLFPPSGNNWGRKIASLIEEKANQAMKVLCQNTPSGQHQRAPMPA